MRHKETVVGICVIVFTALVLIVVGTTLQPAGCNVCTVEEWKGMLFLWSLLLVGCMCVTAVWYVLDKLLFKGE